MADWLSYHNQGATRNQPLAPKLVEAMGFLPSLGITMQVHSGGQDSSGPNRVGSTRHDHGNAGDVDFYQNGRRLDWNNRDDLPILSNIVAQAKANGVTGIGAGNDYMGPGRFHIGFGDPGVWGAGGRSANAPDWLRAAYNGTAPIPPTNIPNVQALASAPVAAPTSAPQNSLWSNPLGALQGFTAPMGQLVASPQMQQAAIGPLMSTAAGRNLISRQVQGMNIGAAPTVTQGHSGTGTRALAVGGRPGPVMLSGGRERTSSSAHGNMNMDVYRANAATLGGRGFTQDNINKALASGKTLYKLA
jgi:hypothetical protein